MTFHPPERTVVMGVSGAGKTTIGTALAEALGGTYLDGDRFHPPANIEKMGQGIPLTDEDRWPWLDRVAQELARAPAPAIGGCSSLKRVYRDRLRATLGDDLLFVHLTGSYEVLTDRMKKRTGHFMPASLLDSQLATLEPPAADETAMTVDIDDTREGIVAGIVRRLAERGGRTGPQGA